MNDNGLVIDLNGIYNISKTDPDAKELLELWIDNFGTLYDKRSVDSALNNSYYNCFQINFQYKALTGQGCNKNNPGYFTKAKYVIEAIRNTQKVSTKEVYDFFSRLMPNSKIKVANSKVYENGLQMLWSSNIENGEYPVREFYVSGDIVEYNNLEYVFTVSDNAECIIIDPKSYKFKILKTTNIKELEKEGVKKKKLQD
jgi:hypothetical protein